MARDPIDLTARPRRKSCKQLCSPIDTTAQSYTPRRLLNAVAEFLGVSSNYRLSLEIGISESQLSRISSREYPVSPLLIVQILDRTNWPITKVRELMGVPYDGGAMPDLLVRRAA